MLGLIGIGLSLVLLMVFAYRGVNVLVLAPLMATLAVLFALDAPLMATYTQVFMPAAGEYIVQYFPLFLLGAIFGKLMDDTGSARTIAHWIAGRIGTRRVVVAIVLACGVLTYGGVSLFVVPFAVFPIAAALYRESGVPKRFIPAAISLGATTFTMTALPGTPAIQNLIPMPFFGTDAFAAPGLGIIGGLVMFGLGVLWLEWRRKRAQAAGEGYGVHENDPGNARPDEPRDDDAAAAEEERRAGPSVAVALAPIVLVVALNFLFNTAVIPNLDTGYLAGPDYGPTTLDEVKGTWAIIAALAISCVVLILINGRSFRNRALDSVNKGTMGSLLPIFNTASEVGYGSVIASLAAFAVLRDAVLGIAPGNPLISLAVAVNALAGITGSASGGMSIALEALGATYAEMARAAGIAPDLLHRVTAIASGGFDALPHNGAVITLLAICGLTHRESYPDIFVVAVLVPVTALIVVITLGTAFGSF